MALATLERREFLPRINPTAAPTELRRVQGYTKFDPDVLQYFKSRMGMDNGENLQNGLAAIGRTVNLGEEMNTSLTGLVYYAFETGQLDKKALIDKFEYGHKRRLNYKDKIMLAAVTDPKSWSVGPDDLAKNLDLDPEIFRTLLARLYARLHVKSLLEARIFSLYEPESSRENIDKPTGLPLTEREMEVLKMKGHGLTNPETSLKLKISQQTVKNHITNIFKKIGASSVPEALTILIQRGELSGADFETILDFSGISSLSETEAKILSLAANGIIETNGEIGYYLGISEKGIKNRFILILRKLNLPDRISAGVLWHFAPQDIKDQVGLKADKKEVKSPSYTPREIEVMTQKASGLKDAQIAEKLSISEQRVKVLVSNAFNKRRVRDSISTIIDMINGGDIDPDYLKEKMDLRSVSRLSTREAEILALMVDSKEPKTSNKEIAKALQVAEDTARNYLTVILKKLGAGNRIHAAMM